MIKKNTAEIEIKKEIGKRFRAFRHAIGKTQLQLARELKVNQATIAHIEQGRFFPTIRYINYLHLGFNLDINWLLGGNVPMFLPGSRDGKACASLLPCHIPYHDLGYALYAELLESMQVLEVERAVLEEAEQAKLLLEKQVEH